MKKVLFFVCVFFLFSAVAFADSANLSGTGNTVKVMNSDVVGMNGEVITLDVYDGDKYAEGYGMVEGGYMEVKVDYDFENTTNQVQKVMMGFPELCGGTCFYETGEMEITDDQGTLYDFYKLVDFQAFDGEEELPITFRSATESELNELVEYPEYNGANWYIYEVTFAPNEIKSITNSYWIMPRDYKGRMSFDYVLETGASWKGAIDSVDVYLALHGSLALYGVANAGPSGYVFDTQNQVVSWHFDDIEPTSDDNIFVAIDYDLYDYWCSWGDETTVSDDEASSYLEGNSDQELYYFPCMAADGDPLTSWVEGVSGDGVGEWVKVSLSSDKTYDKFYILNGYAKSEDLWGKNNRVKKVGLTFSDGQYVTYDLVDDFDGEVISLSSAVSGVDWVKVKILDVYDGSKYDDTAIAEVYFYGMLTAGISGVSNSAFSDIDGYVYEEAIEYIAEKGVVSGYDDGTFRPNNEINRAEMMKIIVEAFYPGEISGSNCFSDVKDDWYAKYVCFGKEKGIVDGYPDGTFKPARTVNYVEALKIALTAFGYVDEHAVPADPWYEIYTDVAGNLGISVSDTANDDMLTRGKMAKLIFNLIIYEQQASAA